MAILAIVFAFVFSPLGIVFGIIGRKQTARTGEGGRGLATAGLILSIIFLVIGIVAAVLIGVMAASFVSAVDDTAVAAQISAQSGGRVTDVTCPGLAACRGRRRADLHRNHRRHARSAQGHRDLRRRRDRLVRLHPGRLTRRRVGRTAPPHPLRPPRHAPQVLITATRGSGRTRLLARSAIDQDLRDVAENMIDDLAGPGHDPVGAPGT